MSTRSQTRPSPCAPSPLAKSPPAVNDARPACPEPSAPDGAEKPTVDPGPRPINCGAQPVIPGTTYYLLRPVKERRCFLQPCALVNSILAFLLAFVAANYGITLHAVCVLRTHVRMVLTDTRGNLPDFLGTHNGWVARVLMVLLGIEESFWKPRGGHKEILRSREAVLEAIVRTIAAPVQFGLVSHGDHWPGLRMGPGSRKLTVRRPKVWGISTKNSPSKVALAMVKPAIFHGVPTGRFRAMVRQAVEQREADLRARREGMGLTFLGLAEMVKSDPLARCPDCEVMVEEPLAAPDQEAEETDRWLGEWRRVYWRAFEAFRHGNRQVLFPYGTFMMVRLAGVLVEPPPGTA